MPNYPLLVITNSASPESLDAMLEPYREVLNETGQHVSGKWDWWEIGGRYSGMLVRRTDQEDCNRAQKSTLDFAEMALMNRGRRLDFVLPICRAIRDTTGLSWSEIERRWVRFAELFPPLEREWLALMEERRVAFGRGEKPEQLDALYTWLVRQNEEMAGLVKLHIPQLSEIFAQPNGSFGVPFTEASPLEWAVRAPSLSVFAVLDHEGWHERGPAGWLASLVREKSAEAWETEVQRLVDRASDVQYLTIVDAHI
jgi:hypothetical protein